MMKQTLLSAFVFVMLQACGDISCTKPCDPSIPSPDPGSCADHTKDPGTLGGPCIDGTLGDYCEGDGLACISGACIPCGSPGEACCGEYSTNGNCSGGGTCTTNSDEFRECDGSCGQVGQPCCGESQNVCDNASGATCDPSTKECVAQEQSCTFSVTDPAQKIPVVDGAGCGDIWVMNAPTYDQAVKCMEPKLNASGLKVLPGSQGLNEYQMCNSGGQNQPNQVYVYAFSNNDAYTCAQNLCAYTCTTSYGSCGP